MKEIARIEFSDNIATSKTDDIKTTLKQLGYTIIQTRDELVYIIAEKMEEQENLNDFWEMRD